MEISQTLIITASLLLLFLFTWLLLRASSTHKNTQGRDHGRRRTRIPSPPALPIVGHLHLLKKKNGPLHRSLAALAARYGEGTGLLRLRFGSRPVLLVSSPAVARECFTVHDVTLADRPGRASRHRLVANDDDDDCPAIASASYGPLWRQLRRLATVHALCAHRLAATASTRDAEARAMAATLWRAGPGEVAVREVAYELLANLIMAVVAGRRMQREETRRLRAMTEAAHAATAAASLHDFVPALRLLDFGRTARRVAAIAKARHRFGQSLLDDYRRRHPVGASEVETPRTVIGDLLREQERSPESLDDVLIRTVCLSLLQAGTGTSSSTIEWAMALLLNNPGVLKKATAEIHATVGTTRLLQESDLAVLPYLRCVVAETLRLFPVAPNLVPHEASRDFTVVTGGQHPAAVARGTTVLVAVYAMQRDPLAWDEPDRFMPERFLDDDAEMVADEESSSGGRWMMPFGMGRRRCPGEGLALRTVGMALGVMIQCFEWERVGKEDEEVDMSEGSGITMPMAVPLVAMCRPQAEMESVLGNL